jgi:uncharacterized protein YdhG (YjbR/CyaY superfamily)
MAKTNFQSVDEYIQSQVPEARPVLEKVRKAIRRAEPRAEERISYQIAGYCVHGVMLIFFAGWQKHYALYPATTELLDAFAEELLPFEVKGNTIRFPYDVPVPVALITRLVRFREREAAEEAARRAAHKNAKKKLTKKATKGATNNATKGVTKKRSAVEATPKKRPVAPGAKAATPNKQRAKAKKATRRDRAVR